MLDHTFDVIAISESKLKDDPVLNISITGYSSPINKGGTMIYVASDLNFKPRKDLEICCF